MLNLHRNQLVCLRQLPKLPAVEHLCLSDNAIGSLVGLGALENSPLRSLTLTHNPVTFTQDYRARWGEGGRGEGLLHLSYYNSLSLSTSVCAEFSPVCQSLKSWMLSPSCQKTLCPPDYISQKPPGCATFCDILLRMDSDSDLTSPLADGKASAKYFTLWNCTGGSTDPQRKPTGIQLFTTVTFLGHSEKTL